MALIWEKQIGETCYQVRTAGNSLRLYTNGIFHSQWNSRAPLAGNLWDLLVMPAFLLPHTVAGANMACAVLGVGGGAVINQLRHFFAPGYTVGVDLDREHLRLARRFFDVKHKHIQLQHEDAATWVERALHQTRRYHYVVEDIFCGSVDSHGVYQPERALDATAHWMQALAGLLTEDGCLVMNFESLHQCKNSEALKWARSNGFFHIFALSRPMYHNAIAVFCRAPQVCSPYTQLMERMTTAGALPARYKAKILDFNVHKIR